MEQAQDTVVYEDALKRLLQAIYDLSLVNPFIAVLQQLEGKSILQAHEAYPEIFTNPKVSPFVSLFLSVDDKYAIRTSSFGGNLKYFIQNVHVLLNNDDTLARINSAFGLDLTNPLRDFAISVLQSVDDKTKQIAVLCAQRSIDFGAAERHFREVGEYITEDEFESISHRLEEMMLINVYNYGYGGIQIQCKTEYAPHILGTFGREA